MNHTVTEQFDKLHLSSSCTCKTQQKNQGKCMVCKNKEAASQTQTQVAAQPPKREIDVDPEGYGGELSFLLKRVEIGENKASPGVMPYIM